MYRLLSHDQTFEDAVKAIVSKNFPMAKAGLTVNTTPERDGQRNFGAASRNIIRERFDETAKNYFIWGASRMGGSDAIM